jgi:hypothetical protein
MYKKVFVLMIRTGKKRPARRRSTVDNPTADRGTWEGQHRKHWQEAVLAFQITGQASTAPPGGSLSTPAGGSSY